jgi:transcriptional regulator with XRE-family HTH domain
MINRVQKILKKYDLSPSQFADHIQIQRSGISHILSGRNKPSLDFVMKTLTAFPELNSDWLIFGKGEMIKSDEPVFIESKVSDLDPKTKNQKAENVKSFPQTYLSDPDLNSQKIERIIIFYNDKTFDEFSPK